jgi:hypothetical protein
VLVLSRHLTIADDGRRFPSRLLGVAIGAVSTRDMSSAALDISAHISRRLDIVPLDGIRRDSMMGHDTDHQGQDHRHRCRMDGVTAARLEARSAPTEALLQG